MFDELTPVYLELMGRGRIAGHIKKADTEGFWELTVPETSAQKAFTKFITTGAIFAMTQVPEESVQRLAENLKETPVDIYYLREGPVDDYPDVEYDGYPDDEDDYWEDMDDEFGPDDDDDEPDGEPVLALPDF